MVVLKQCGLLGIIGCSERTVDHITAQWQSAQSACWQQDTSSLLWVSLAGTVFA